MTVDLFYMNVQVCDLRLFFPFYSCICSWMDWTFQLNRSNRPGSDGSVQKSENNKNEI